VRGGEVDHDGFMFRGSIFVLCMIGASGQTFNVRWVGDDTKPEAIQHVPLIKVTLPLI
jgi:hypothetical protein